MQMNLRIPGPAGAKTLPRIPSDVATRSATIARRRPSKAPRLALEGFLVLYTGVSIVLTALAGIVAFAVFHATFWIALLTGCCSACVCAWQARILAALR